MLFLIAIAKGKMELIMHFVTGTRSGLGKFLQEELKAVGFARGDILANIQNNTQSPFDSIIHCAFNVNPNLTSRHLETYLSDNLLLIQQLLEIPHKKFIFISSADVYPQGRTTIWKEDDEFAIDKIRGVYALTKLMAEALVKNKSQNYLILRPTALLGNYSRPNSLIKILNGNSISLTLNGESNFNYILHQDVLQFIQKAFTSDLCGTFNLAASTSISLNEVANFFNRDVQFGSYVYQVANLCNKKVIGYCDVFSNSSLDNIKRYQTLKG